MSHNYNLVVICGLARSGTTYVGRALSIAKGVHLINEPLNKDFGVKGVLHWYSYVDEADQGNNSDTKELIKGIINFRTGWTQSSPPEYPLLTRLSKRMYGGRSGLVWSALRLKKFLRLPFQTVCLKDPFATFSVDHIIKSYGAQVVCMIKHPCALYLSQKRRGKAEHIKDLFAQHKLRDRYAGDISADTWKLAIRNHSAGVALLWKIMARAITSQAKDLKNLLIVRHEDLCLNPAKVMKSIYTHFGIAYGRRIEKYLYKTSQANQVYAKAGKLHSFRRNSLALREAWRGVISPQEEAMIREVIGNDIYLVYEHW